MCHGDPLERLRVQQQEDSSYSFNTGFAKQQGNC